MSAAPGLLTPRVLLPFALVTLIWGSTWIVITGQLCVVPPSWSVAYRFFTGAAAMFAYAAWRRERLTLSGAGWGFAALLGLAQFAFNFNFVYRAEQHITSGLVAVLFALLIGALLLKEPAPPIRLLACGVIAAGVAILRLL